MSLGIVLDVAIGLVFTYLLMAIIVSGVVELVAGWAKWRGKDLRDGMASLLNADEHPMLKTLFNAVQQHGLISNTPTDRLPSYVPSRNFALALADILKQGGSGTAFSRIQAGIQALPSGAVKQTLSSFVTEAAGDADLLQKRIETWFDDSMDRLTGAYKRHTQLWMLGLGFVAAVVLNVDSIALARTLWTDSSVRSAMVAAAQQYAKEPLPTGGDAKERVKAANCELARLPLPIGWTRPASNAADPCKDGAMQPIVGFKDALKVVQERLTTGSWFWMLIGWLVTAAAVSFGAPFWFDALKNLLNVRNAGPKPERTDAKGAAK